MAIETKLPGYENMSLHDVFEKLHDNIYSIKFDSETHMKAKLNLNKPFLRLYAILLEDGTYVITGGAIKLTKKMAGNEFDSEFINLKRVQEYFKRTGIINRQGLIEN